jgi:hypothetical protein
VYYQDRGDSRRERKEGTSRRQKRRGIRRLYETGGIFGRHRSRR